MEIANSSWRRAGKPELGVRLSTSVYEPVIVPYFGNVRTLSGMADGVIQKPASRGQLTREDEDKVRATATKRVFHK
jgi:hypothetical protein